MLLAPERPGNYQLELALEQIDGARFSAPGNVTYRQNVLVTPLPKAAPNPQRRRRPSATVPGTAVH